MRVTFSRRSTRKRLATRIDDTSFGLARPHAAGETNAVNSAAFRRLNSPNFGRILSAASRLVQSTLKLMF
jgi:hypothetical protein